ncbi:MAG: hypothetical protein ACPGJF_05610 [Sinimarinibacterium flocculans]|uniref:hypothetical protein n=1 Tax=Sinimarinibacterium flocculans TaxID=985250 RepID=UPI003C3F9511
MTIDRFSTETLAYLERIHPDLGEAIQLASDAELQQISPTYLELRQTMDEPAVKSLMLEAARHVASPAERERSPKVEQTPRERLLHQMKDLTSQEDVRALLEGEIEKERAGSELTALIAIADQVGDTALAHRLGGKLADLSGFSATADEPAPNEFDSDLPIPKELRQVIPDLESRMEQPPPAATAKRGLLSRISAFGRHG